MTDHIEIRDLLALQAANALNPEEQQRVQEHLQECAFCRDELASLESLAAGLKRIPETQPTLGLAQRTRTRIRAEMTAKAERKQYHRYLAVMIGFAWIVTVLTFLGGKYLAIELAARLNISPDTCVNVFVTYMVVSGMASVAFAGIVATRHRNKRRLI
jgi:predicted anti-sigma-YlaC factor YlaD